MRSEAGGLGFTRSMSSRTSKYSVRRKMIVDLDHLGGRACHRARAAIVLFGYLRHGLVAARPLRVILLVLNFLDGFYKLGRLECMPRTDPICSATSRCRPMIQLISPFAASSGGFAKIRGTVCSAGANLSRREFGPEPPWHAGDSEAAASPDIARYGRRRAQRRRTARERLRRMPTETNNSSRGRNRAHSRRQPGSDRRRERARRDWRSQPLPGAACRGAASAPGRPGA